MAVTIAQGEGAEFLHAVFYYNGFKECLASVLSFRSPPLQYIYLLASSYKPSFSLQSQSTVRA